MFFLSVTQKIDSFTLKFSDELENWLPPISQQKLGFLVDSEGVEVEPLSMAESH